MEIKTKSDPYGNVGSLAEMSNDQAQSINNQSSEWIATFRGFFWGEGGLYMNRYERKSHGPKYSYNVNCRIQLREDDSEILREFQNVFGGSISKCTSNGNSKPSIQWSVNKIRQCWSVCEALDGNPKMPFRKCLQLPIWKRALEIKMANADKTTYPGQLRYSNSEIEYLDFAFHELRRLKKWIDNNNDG